jgi:hypothetical protein
MGGDTHATWHRHLARGIARWPQKTKDRATLASVAPAAGPVKEVLTDNGFCIEAAVDHIEHNDEGQPADHPGSASPTLFRETRILRALPHGLRTI